MPRGQSLRHHLKYHLEFILQQLLCQQEDCIPKGKWTPQPHKPCNPSAFSMLPGHALSLLTPWIVSRVKHPVYWILPFLNMLLNIYPLWNLEADCISSSQHGEEFQLTLKCSPVPEDRSWYEKLRYEYTKSISKIIPNAQWGFRVIVSTFTVHLSINRVWLVCW